MSGKFIFSNAQQIANGDLIVDLGADGRMLPSSMPVHDVERASDADIQLRMGDDGMASLRLPREARLLVFRGGAAGDVQDTPLLPAQEARLREARLGDREIAEINARGGYLRATHDLEFMASIQDKLDAYFSQRIVEVRNALRAIGWGGEMYRPLSLPFADESVGLFTDYVYPTPSKNVVAMSYSVAPKDADGRAPRPRVGLFDDLSKSPDLLALHLHGVAQQYAVFLQDAPIILDRYGDVLRSRGATCWRGTDLAKAIEVSKQPEKLDPYSYTVCDLLKGLPLMFKVDEKNNIHAGFDVDSPDVFSVGRFGAALDVVGVDAAEPDSSGPQF